MIEEKELIELMTKTGEAYFRGKTDEGNIYAGELIPKLDFSEKRDQEVLLQVLGHALVRNDELCVLDILNDAGFNFDMEFQRGGKLTDFFAKFPKFKNGNDGVLKKIGELTGVSPDDTLSRQKLQELFTDNKDTFNLWWDNEGDFWDSDCRVASDELNESILDLSGRISVESAQDLDDNGLSILHNMVWHNYYEAAKKLLDEGADPNVCGGLNRKNSSDVYLGITPLHIACYFGNYKMVRLLAEHGADTLICDDKGRNCLHYTASMSFYDITRCTAQNKCIEQRLDIIPFLKCDLNAGDKCGITPVMQLVKNRNYSGLSKSLIREFINRGADLNMTDKNGNNALMLAAANNQVTAALEIIKESDKEYLNLQNNDGDTALHIAVREDSYEIAYALLLKKADAQIKNNKDETVAGFIADGYRDDLFAQVIKGRPYNPKQLVNIINHAFFDCSCENKDKLSFAMLITEKLLGEIDEDDDEEIAYIMDILYSALLEDKDGNILDALNNAGFDFVMPISYQGQMTTIRDYCLHNNFDVGIIRKLIDMGVDMDESIVKGKTPANIVARLEENNSARNLFLGQNSKKTVNYYAEAAKLFSVSSMEELDAEGMSALHWAARRNHIEMMRVMLDAGADINIAEDSEKMSGTTPLHIACIYGNIEMVKLLMEYGADDSIMNVSGNTAAHYAVKEIESYIKVDYEKRAKIVELLNNIDIPRNDGKTPLILVQDGNYNDAGAITPILIGRGADVNHADNAGNTALLVQTYWHCNKDVVKELVRAGADVNARNANGDTALHMALRGGNENVARLLIKKGADYEIANNKGQTPADIAVEKGYETVIALMG